jgi:hypothetical protein
MQAIHFKWVRHPETGQPHMHHVPICDTYLCGVGFDKAGNLINPTKWPDEVVHRAVTEAIARREQRRKNGAAKAAATRKRRREMRVNDIVKKLVREEKIGPRTDCYLCRKKLGDAESIARGIGSDCWQDVLAHWQAHLEEQVA